MFFLIFIIFERNKIPKSMSAKNIFRILNYIVDVTVLLVFIASITHVEFPFRKQLLYTSLVYVLVMDIGIQILRKKK